MKLLLDTCIVIGAVGSFGSFILLALTFWKSYRGNRPIETVWEKHPHGDLPEKEK